MSNGRLLLVLIGLFCFSNLALADTLVVGGPVTGTTLTIKDSALTALNSGWANGVQGYIDPYKGSLNGQTVLLFCIDPDHLDNGSTSGYPVTISPNGLGGSTLQALNLAGQATPTSHTLSSAAMAAGFTNAAQLYGGLAWLSQGLQSSSIPLTQQEYQAAIWQLGDYTSTFAVVNPPAGFDSSLVTSLEQQARTKALTGGFAVLTDSNEVANGKNAGQEYIILTPEPGSALLLVSGFMGLMLFHKRTWSTKA